MSLKMTEEWHAAAMFLDPFYTVYPIGLRCFWGLWKEQSFLQLMYAVN